MPELSYTKAKAPYVHTADNCVYIYEYKSIYIRICICLFLYAYIYIHTHACTHVQHIYICIRTHAHAVTCLVYIYIYVYIQCFALHVKVWRFCEFFSGCGQVTLALRNANLAGVSLDIQHTGKAMDILTESGMAFVGRKGSIAQRQYCWYTVYIYIYKHVATTQT